MPIKLAAPGHDEEEARIEIVPLIDIMFFLLATMMLVSLGAVKLKLLKAELPVAVASSSAKADTSLTLVVSKEGFMSLDGRPLAEAEAVVTLKRIVAGDPATRIILAADKDTRNESLVRALAFVRAAGIDRVALAAKAADAK